MNSVTRNNQIEGARRYASADRSDPFAYGRAMAHIKQGLADDLEPGKLAYDAEEIINPQPGGNTHKNMVRL